MNEPSWGRRREGVINALTRLATITAHNLTELPDLTDAVHWLVDDTDWDQRSTVQDIGLLLRDRTEADALTAVLEVLLAVLDDLGPLRPDSDYLRHPRWPDVRARSASARDLLAGSDRDLC